METLWIDNGEDLAEFCAQIDGEAIAVDAESDHFHAYQARVCLLQVATERAEALIDPLALDADELAPFFALLEDPSIVKVLHAGRNDINEFDRDWGVGILNLFDTQIAARFLGYERNALSWLLEELVGVAPGGQYQRFDWTTRPIPEDARRYAAVDVRHLLELRSRFTSELAESGWLEAFEQQCAYVSSSVEFTAKAFDPDAWRKVNGSSKLDGRGRAALRALYVWRHELCSELNQSPVTTLKDGALVRLAKRRPTSASELAAVRGASEAIVSEHADGLIEAVQRSLGADIPPEDAPYTPYKSPPAAQKARYNALRSWRNKKASQLDIPKAFVATNARLSEIAENPPSTLEELAAFDAVLDWHREQFGQEILGVLDEN